MVNDDMEKFKDKSFRTSDDLFCFNVVFTTVVYVKTVKDALEIGYSDLLHNKGKVEIICLG